MKSIILAAALALVSMTPSAHGQQPSVSEGFIVAWPSPDGGKADMWQGVLADADPKPLPVEFQQISGYKAAWVRDAAGIIAGPVVEAIVVGIMDRLMTDTHTKLDRIIELLEKQQQ